MRWSRVKWFKSNPSADASITELTRMSKGKTTRVLRNRYCSGRGKGSVLRTGPFSSALSNHAMQVPHHVTIPSILCRSPQHVRISSMPCRSPHHVKTPSMPCRSLNMRKSHLDTKYLSNISAKCTLSFTTDS